MCAVSLTNTVAHLNSSFYVMLSKQEGNDEAVLTRLMLIFYYSEYGGIDSVIQSKRDELDSKRTRWGDVGYNVLTVRFCRNGL